MKFFLITTALKETWPLNDENVIFLGEWCKIYEDKFLWIKYNSQTQEYHWNDRKKLKRDFEYLNKLFDDLLNDLVLKLNKIHKVNYNVKYWKIIIGPWLMVFISILFDRWESLRLCFDKFKISKTIFLKNKPENIVPSSMEDFSKKIETDEWNHYIFSQIIDSNYNHILINKIDKLKEKKNIKIKKKNLLQILKENVKKILHLPSAFSEVFIYHSYLGKKQQIELNLKLKQIPYLDGIKDNIRRNYDYENFRNWNLFNTGNKNINNFENFLYKNVSKHMPSSYLENYENLVLKSKRKFWPKKPNVIFTSNAHYMDEVFKIWTANKIKDHNSKLVIGQHGGHWGQGLFNFTENYELSIADKFLSWGWSEKNKKNIYPVGIIKPIIPTKKDNLKEKMIFMLLGTDRYSHNLQSIPISSQWINYFDNQVTFLKNLKDIIRNKVYFRLYPHDYHWNQKKRLEDNISNPNIFDKNLNYFDTFLDCKLAISGWNSTTFLETLASNIPTIIFWDEKYFELRTSAIDDFEVLKKANIYFDNPTNAANHINSIWDDIDFWWNDIETQNARKFFLNKYAKLANITNEIANELKN